MCLSLETLEAAAIGAVAAVPLVGLRVWSWGPAAFKTLPILEDMHQIQLEVVKPYLQGMGRGHVALMMALEVLPLTLLLLPAAQGVIGASSDMYSGVSRKQGQLVCCL